MSESTWRTVARYARTRSPTARVLICACPAPLDQRLRDDGPAAQVTMVHSADEAHTVLTAVPMPPSVALSLTADPMSACTGRTAAGDACLRWGLAHLSHHARLITSELVTNAVGHVRTGLTLQVSLRTGVLHLAVQDSSAVLPRLLAVRPYHPGQPLELPGTGLRIVDAVATAWGALACHAGKVVWATLAASERGVA
ncbi:ATP-binding protein [Jidongwangia harbinensis]|uniref:ATP-binding protein n=1 Tax=Jidongwangia harbinensis TaxID=2878561 RepID=UPI001CD9A9E4|nr:ATP-binding protein [Jidongwangia harbinensis]MCA2218655.1 ATP-binding protein [Jidongwangia harbinensis]